MYKVKNRGLHWKTQPMLLIFILMVFLGVLRVFEYNNRKDEIIFMF